MSALIRMCTFYQLKRTFSPFYDSEDLEPDYEHWYRLASGDKLSWSDLLKKRLVVILGEAGIGKTFEFQNQAKILAADGQPAFFLSLNQLDAPGGFEQAIIEQQDQYEKWRQSTNAGFFFLDAIDEACLNSLVAFQKALTAVRQALSPYLRRTSFYVSSRITDWNVPGVQDAVRQHLLNPLVAAEAADMPVAMPTGETVALEEKASATIALEVFKLDPLSAPDARRLAVAFGATPVDAFWKQVEDGDYEFLATRPLDLEWLVDHWKQDQSLGTYSELLESAVTHRLTEKNPSYVRSDAVLSRAQLREGAEWLAAACVFSGRAYVQVGEGEPVPGTVAVHPDHDSAYQ
jgi:NACHT domain.